MIVRYGLYLTRSGLVAKVRVDGDVVRGTVQGVSFKGIRSKDQETTWSLDGTHECCRVDDLVRRLDAVARAQE